jgi:hypothetical protein
MSSSYLMPPERAGQEQKDLADEPAWFEALAFDGPLDPGGTLFAFLLSLAATVAVVVLIAAGVRMAGLG